MARPVTLFTGQWADLPLEELARKASDFGYDGLELACWGDHFDVDAGPDRAGLLQHEAGVAGAARPPGLRHQQSPGRPGRAGQDRRPAPGDPAAGGLGRRRSGRSQRPGGRGDEERRPRGAEAGGRRGQRLHRFEHLAVVVLLPARPAGFDRRRLRSPWPSDSTRSSTSSASAA